MPIIAITTSSSTRVKAEEVRAGCGGPWIADIRLRIADSARQTRPGSRISECEVNMTAAMGCEMKTRWPACEEKLKRSADTQENVRLGAESP
jgi:hypothetical protein